MSYQEIANIPKETPEYFKVEIAYDCALVRDTTRLVRASLQYLQEAVDVELNRHAHKHQVAKTAPCSPHLEQYVRYSQSNAVKGQPQNYVFIGTILADWENDAFNYALTDVSPSPTE